MGVGTPDISIFLKISPDELTRRMKKSQKVPDKFESDLIFQRRVAEQYDLIARVANTDKGYFGNIHVVNAEGDLTEISQRVWGFIEPVYSNWLG